MREINTLQPGEAMSAEDADVALQRLNQMGHAFTLDGVGWNWQTLGLDDVVPFPESHERGLRVCLAAELCPAFDKAVPGDLEAMAGRAKRQFVAEYRQHQDVELDVGLTSFAANRRSDGTHLT